MVVKNKPKPRIVIIGAGMAGLTAANKLYTSQPSNESFELIVVEGGERIGGRINTSVFCGDQIEMGATWIHGIGGSPIHKIAQETHALQSDQPWECMGGVRCDPLTVAEGGHEISDLCHVQPISILFNKLMDFAQGKVKHNEDMVSPKKNSSIGSFLRDGLERYLASVSNSQDDIKCYGSWTKKLLEEAIFAMLENTQRTYSSAGDLSTLDYDAESEYKMFPGEEITIAKGYLSIIHSLASVLPPGVIQLGRKVSKIEWRPVTNNGITGRPVRLHFCDGSSVSADHVVVTVSLGVLKARISDGFEFFDPPLPIFKIEAISRLGFGVVNKLFLELGDKESDDLSKLYFPFLQLVFHRLDSDLKDPKIPWWMRKTASLCPIYRKSSVLLSWFAGEEAIELESLKDEEILKGVSSTISSFLSKSGELGDGKWESIIGRELKFSKVLRSQWGSDPLFLGSYSFVAVGSTGDDIDTLAEPLPSNRTRQSSYSPPLQILFAGEATHRTHYSTTHGAYFSGLREANRLLEHYQCIGV